MLKKTFFITLLVLVSCAISASATESFNFDTPAFIHTDDGFVANPDFDFEAFDRYLMEIDANTPQEWYDGYDFGYKDGYDDGYSEGFMEGDNREELADEINELHESNRQLEEENTELQDKLKKASGGEVFYGITTALLILVIIYLVYRLEFFR